MHTSHYCKRPSNRRKRKRPEAPHLAITTAAEAQFIQQNSIVVSDAVLLATKGMMTGTGNAASQNIPAGASFDEWSTHMANREEENSKALLEIIRGEITRIHHRGCMATGTVHVRDNGTHKCTAACSLKPLDISLYQFSKDRFHVCVVAAGVTGTCAAPACFHQGRVLQRMCGTFYLCASTGCVHACEVGLCDAQKHSDIEGSVCTLTGKVFPDIARDNLSHGWVEDPWRLKKACPLGTTPAPSVGKGKAITTTKAANNSRVAEMVAQITEMFPGGETRRQVELRLRNRVISKLLYQWEKYVRRCRQLRTPLVLTTLCEYMVHANNMLSHQTAFMGVDPERMCGAAHAYARCITEFYNTLLHETAIAEDAIAIADFVVAVLYLQKTSFTVDDVLIFPHDSFLAYYLPTANTLEHYPSVNKNTFTNNKTLIQRRIIEAVKDKGVPPEQLAFPVLSFEDLFA